MQCGGYSGIARATLAREYLNMREVGCWGKQLAASNASDTSC